MGSQKALCQQRGKTSRWGELRRAATFKEKA